MQNEKSIEKYIGDHVRPLGFLWLKFVSPGNAGVPDRLLITPWGRTIYVEIKDKAGVLSKQQVRQIRRLSKQGCQVYVVRGETEARHLIDIARGSVAPGLRKG